MDTIFAQYVNQQNLPTTFFTYSACTVYASIVALAQSQQNPGPFSNILKVQPKHQF